MISRAQVIEWGARAPWPTEADIEQDLILSRLMVDIANNDLLGDELTMRGGTCLHKLHLPEPLGYSEDLDYVRRTRSGIKPYMPRCARSPPTSGSSSTNTARSAQRCRCSRAMGSSEPVASVSITGWSPRRALSVEQCDCEPTLVADGGGADPGRRTADRPTVA